MTPGGERPSRIVIGTGELTLTARGAGLVVAALEIAMSQAERNGVRYRGRTQWDDVAWLYEQARTIAAGPAASAVSASGPAPRPWQLVVPASDVPLAELLSARQAAAILGVTPRQVRRMIQAGQLPGRKVGREWVTTDYAARHAAGRGRRAHADHQPPGRAPGAGGGGQRENASLAGALLGRPHHDGRPGRRAGGGAARAADTGPA